MNNTRKESEKHKLLPSQLPCIQDPLQDPGIPGTRIPFLGFPASLSIFTRATEISYLQIQSCQEFGGQE